MLTLLAAGAAASTPERALQPAGASTAPLRWVHVRLSPSPSRASLLSLSHRSPRALTPQIPKCGQSFALTFYAYACPACAKDITDQLLAYGETSAKGFSGDDGQAGEVSHIIEDAQLRGCCDPSRLLEGAQSPIGHVPAGYRDLGHIVVMLRDPVQRLMSHCIPLPRLERWPSFLRRLIDQSSRSLRRGRPLFRRAGASEHDGVARRAQALRLPGVDAAARRPEHSAAGAGGSLVRPRGRGRPALARAGGGGRGARARPEQGALRRNPRGVERIGRPLPRGLRRRQRRRARGAREHSRVAAEQRRERGVCHPPAQASRVPYPSATAAASAPSARAPSAHGLRDRLPPRDSRVVAVRAGHTRCRRGWRTRPTKLCTTPRSSAS